jgi:hypothetical protein
MQKFVTGNEVMWKGWAVVVMGLAIGAFWGFFAYTVGTLNLAMLEPLIRILGVVLGVGIAIRILLSIVQKISKTR